MVLVSLCRSEEGTWLALTSWGTSAEVAAYTNCLGTVCCEPCRKYRPVSCNYKPAKPAPQIANPTPGIPPPQGAKHP